MINTISPSSKSGASKWMMPQSIQDQEQNSQNVPLHSFFKGGPQKIMGSTSSGPVKALSIYNPNLSSGEGFQSKENNQSNTSLNKSKRFELNILPKRMALSFSPPPTIIMEYLVPKTGKLYHHKIKIRGLSWESDTEKVLEQVKRRHEMYLTKISDVKLLKLISILQERIGIEEGKISGVIKPQAQQNNTNSKKETDKNRPQYKKELTSDEEDYNYDDFEDYAAYGDQEHSKRQDEEEEEESNDINDKQQEEGNEESEEEKQRAGDFEFDAKAVFQSNGKDDGDADNDQEEEEEEDDNDDQEEEDVDDDEDENEEGEGDNEEEEEEEEDKDEGQNEQNENSQEERKLKNEKCSGNNIIENIKHKETQEDTKLDVKRNNFIDAKKEFDFFEDDEFRDSMEDHKPQKEESSESEEEDIYQQVKKQLDSQKGIKSQTVSSYKGNIQSQKYSIQHYIKEQNSKEEENDQEQEEESETQEKSQEDKQQNNNNNKESSDNNEENQSQEDELVDEVDYDNYDLNKLKREEVEKHKKMMDKQFEANRKKPGQIGFLYDMRMEFDPEESNDWDKSQNRMNTNEDNHIVDYDFV